MRKLVKIICFLCLNLLWGSAYCAHAGVVFFDSVTTVHTPIYLKVLTKGFLLPEGGRRVDIYSEGQLLGRSLSGGDGYGYMKLIPKETGLKTYEARMNGYSDSANLLVMKKTDRALLLEFEVIGRDFLSQSAGNDARNALNILCKKFKLIYLTRFVGPAVAKKIIAAANLPASVVLAWQGPDLFEDLKSRQIAVTAIIGSAETVAEAEDEVPHRFTFEESEDETFAKDWEVIIKKLRPN